MNIWKQDLKGKCSETLTAAYVERMCWEMQEGQIFNKNFYVNSGISVEMFAVPLYGSTDTRTHIYMWVFIY